jgi:hypothetical protein
MGERAKGRIGECAVSLPASLYSSYSLNSSYSLDSLNSFHLLAIPASPN